MSKEKDQLRESSAEFADKGQKFDKAIDAVLAGSVKQIRFTPSGRKIFVVVGKMGDEFIDPEKPYCSCSNFFFRVLSGKDDLCYHLLSYKIAVKVGRVDLLEFTDEEYAEYLAATIGDVFQVLDRSSG